MDAKYAHSINAVFPALVPLNVSGGLPDGTHPAPSSPVYITFPLTSTVVDQLRDFMSGGQRLVRIFGREWLLYPLTCETDLKGGNPESDTITLIGTL